MTEAELQQLGGLVWCGPIKNMALAQSKHKKDDMTNSLGRSIFLSLPIYLFIYF